MSSCSLVSPGLGGILKPASVIWESRRIKNFLDTRFRGYDRVARCYCANLGSDTVANKVMARLGANILRSKQSDFSLCFRISRTPAANYFNSEVQCGQRVALMGMADRQWGQSLVAGAGAGFRKRFICLMIRKIANAMIKKLRMVLRKIP
jgi:hypothetical protein